MFDDIKCFLKLYAHFGKKKKNQKEKFRISLVPSCALAMWTITKGKMGWHARSYFSEIDSIAEVLNYCSV